MQTDGGKESLPTLPSPRFQLCVQQTSPGEEEDVFPLREGWNVHHDLGQGLFIEAVFATGSALGVGEKNHGAVRFHQGQGEMKLVTV